MIKRYLGWMALASCLLGGGGLRAQQMVTLTAAKLSDLGGNRVTGQLCLSPADNYGTATGFMFGGGGQAGVQASCGTVTAGAVSMPAPDTAFTNPLNVCVKAQLMVGSRPVRTFNCLQPASTGQTTWCSTAAGVTTCNLDNFLPTAPPGTVLATGPTGATGATGAAGPAGPDIAGLSSDSNNGINVTGNVKGAIVDNGGQVFNVKAYGAKGNGVTDDTAAIQALINANASLGIIYFPPGTYAVAGQLSLPNHVTMIGSSRSASEILFTGNGTGSDCGTNSVVPTSTEYNAGYVLFRGGNIELSQLTLRANDKTVGTCILNINNQNVEISGVTLSHLDIIGGSTNSTNTSIYLYAVDDIQVDHSVLEDSAQHMLFGPHTAARIDIGPDDVFSFGTNTSLYMIQFPVGGNNFNLHVHDDTFEGYETGHGISGPAALSNSGCLVNSNYFGDANLNAGPWIQGCVSDENMVSGAGTAVYALYQPMRVIGGTVTGAVENPSNGSLYMQSYYLFPSGMTSGMSVNQLSNILSIANQYNGSGYSIQAANSLTPHPQLVSIADQDSTTNKFKLDGNLLVRYLGFFPSTYTLAPTCANASVEGNTWTFTDSTVTAIGAAISGGGTNHVLGYCGTDGTTYAWRVASSPTPGGSVAPTVTGCGTISGQKGGTAGTFVTDSTSCTAVLSALPASAHGYACLLWDQTHESAPKGNVSSTVNSVAFSSLTTTAGDTLAYQCGLSY